MFVLVNLKAYPCEGPAVAAAVREVSEESGVRMAVAPQAAELRAIHDTGAETWAQHVSPVEHGSHTGSTLAEAVADAGAAGTLINHSERRLRLADVDGALSAAERAGLETVVCANNPAQVGAAAALSPDAVAVEPPELIGGDVSVSTADPGIVEDAVDAAAAVDEDVAVFCGAGVSTGSDVAAAQELGAEGVLLASGVAKADDPEAVLWDLVSEI
ncbi:Triosephosphate isomerase [Halalkaliarchaeum sp. AArc-CO]|uniref:triose-phosphate isomerase n=1 Tax=unclassified Halalkaliarchaeum TaxID=2678344 RepID=UPI00217DA389|nr:MULTISPECIES: triose-phosphate isomerase [unclassified Halalkaliarchaeum]MDR5672100.1 triose-phosphate isomerase [Halalkaliarchaeum sp. AArc-GB]UWG51599.1 Triosephosphate isomerase [Halalkaliarchaeum sp. AArc-CO]